MTKKFLPEIFAILYLKQSCRNASVEQIKVELIS